MEPDSSKKIKFISLRQAVSFNLLNDYRRHCNRLHSRRIFVFYNVKVIKNSNRIRTLYECIILELVDCDTAAMLYYIKQVLMTKVEQFSQEF